MAAVTTAHFGQSFQNWLSDLGFTEDPFAPCAWSETALRALIAHRLMVCSHGRITQLEDLCHPKAKAHTLARLLEAAQGSPQTLLRLCDALLHHVAAQGQAVIAAEDVTAALNHCRKPSAQIETAPTDTGSASPTLPRNGLFLDAASGHVWIERRQLTPPLTGQEFALLHILYASAPEIVACETLIHAIWPADHALVGDEQNLRKLISRLRRRLEPQGAGNDWRFIRSVRGRGYWLNLDVEGVIATSPGTPPNTD